MPTRIFFDQFTTAESAPITSPRQAEPGPGEWVVTDTNDRVDIIAASGGRLRMSGVVAWNDPALWTFDSLASADVGAIFAVIRVHGWSGRHALFVADSQAPSNPQNVSAGAILSNTHLHAPRVYESDGTTRANVGLANTHMRAIDYGVCVIPRDGGGFWTMISGGAYGTFPNARRVWIGSRDAWNDLWVGLTGDGDNTTINYKSVSVIERADLPEAWQERFHMSEAFDAFSGSGTINGRTTDHGGHTWSLADGSVDGTITGGSLENAGNFYAYIQRSTNAQVLEMTWTQQAVDSNNANRFAGLILRSSGTAQSSFHRVAYFANQNGWVIFDGSSVLNPIISLHHPVIGTTYTLRVYDTGSAITVYLLNHSTGVWVRLWNNFAISASGTRCGVYSGTNDRSVIHEFVTWPIDPAIELPSVVGDMPALASVGDAIYQTSFESASTVNLDGFEPDALNPSGWQVDDNYIGTIAMQVNASLDAVELTSAMPSDDSFQIVATRETGSQDHSIETVIELNDDPNENYMVGAVIRYTDLNNWIIARYLEQGRGDDLDNEIEVWQRVNGGTPFLMPMVNLRQTYQAGDTCRLRFIAHGDQIETWHASTATGDLELVAQGHIDPALTGTRCGIAVDASTGFGGGNPLWHSATFALIESATAEPVIVTTQDAAIIIAAEATSVSAEPTSVTTQDASVIVAAEATSISVSATSVETSDAAFTVHAEATLVNASATVVTTDDASIVIAAEMTSIALASVIVMTEDAIIDVVAEIASVSAEPTSVSTSDAAFTIHAEMTSIALASVIVTTQDAAIVIAAEATSVSTEPTSVTTQDAAITLRAESTITHTGTSPVTVETSDAIIDIAAEMTSVSTEPTSVATQDAAFDVIAEPTSIALAIVIVTTQDARADVAAEITDTYTGVSPVTVETSDAVFTVHAEMTSVSAEPTSVSTSDAIIDVAAEITTVHTHVRAITQDAAMIVAAETTSVSAEPTSVSTSDAALTISAYSTTVSVGQVAESIISVSVSLDAIASAHIEWDDAMNALYRGDDRYGTVFVTLESDENINGWHVVLTAKWAYRDDDSAIVFMCSTHDETLDVIDPSGPVASLRFKINAADTEHIELSDAISLVYDVRGYSPSGDAQTWHVDTLTVKPNVLRGFPS
jgi:hypothetical protein